MHGHMIKARISHLTKYSDLSRKLSVFTQVSRQDDHVSKTYGLTPKPLWSNVVDTKRYLVHCNRWILYGHVARLSTVGKKTGMKEDERKSTSYKRKTWEDNSPMILLIDDKGKIMYCQVHGLLFTLSIDVFFQRILYLILFLYNVANISVDYVNSRWRLASKS